MILVDANLLLYARDSTSSQHAVAISWLTERLNGIERVGLPWESLVAFARISTHPRVFAHPLTPAEAWAQVREWLAARPAWIPLPTQQHAEVLGELVERHHVGGNLISDAHLAALAIEHGLIVCSADSDFARFPELNWRNPLQE